MQTISQHRAEKIARNINAMDTSYQYIDNLRKWKFWDRLDNKLRSILSTLTPEDKNVIAQMCEEKEAKYFGIKN
ncbi:hypothetical protein [Chryseobacterium indoltheticum]|uniref:Uncharacterized protein n=1 Tax=Chryseobacterium indoltheticum TaxID=254 RepID=A0A381FAA3_9FLAO|nr:hypothetical protein [Chryseobacterium indoltheticum]AZA75887.1 hypothetical protein EG358_07110 [Chryseobacterium indoltheticum]SIR25236.1 hypothetical protein SAMN05421682_115126 [Chryseobacterium indoltheticum]SUX43447.1 Uncharacterised protein [Chryseobacterium indoltheticum]